MTAPIPARVAERAATSIIVDENGCHISTYSLGSHGYAQIGWNDDEGHRHMTTAHRASWVHHTGLQPLDTIDHLCHVRRCVNGAHLRDIPNEQNARRNRGDASGDLSTCLNGHSSPYVQRKRDGRLSSTCIECERDRTRRTRAKHDPA